MYYRQWKHNKTGHKENVVDIYESMKSWESFDDMYDTDEGAEYWMEFVHEVIDMWIELNKDNETIKQSIMKEYEIDNDEGYEDFLYDTQNFYEWFCENTKQNEDLKVYSMMFMKDNEAVS